VLQQTNNGGIFLFPPLIWKFSYQFDYKVLQPKFNDLFDQVELNSILEKGNALSTVSLPISKQPHGWSELADFQNWLGEKINHIRTEFEFYETHSEVQNSWVNRHLQGGETLAHSHSYSTFVASCYVQCPPNSGNIEFKDPLEYHKHCFPIIPEYTFYKEVECNTNDVIIFPAWLIHRTQPNNTSQERIVMTFNIK
jgi:uncharacterized protein (TIGR02466 family)